MKKNYDLATIMRRAWAIRKEQAAAQGVKVSAISMAYPMRQAWAEAQGKTAKASALASIAEWAAKSTGEQVKMIRACVRKAAKNVIGHSIEDHYLQYIEIPAFTNHHYDEYVDEAYVHILKAIELDHLTAINDKRNAQGKQPLTLISIVYRAARASIVKIYRDDIKHGKAQNIIVSDGEGNEESYIEAMAPSKRDNTERSAMIRECITKMQNDLDQIGQKILHHLVMGKTEREIAIVVGLSNVAVHKRIVKMRASLEYLRTA